jgi:hypothetical protein
LTIVRIPRIYAIRLEEAKQVRIKTDLHAKGDELKSSKPPPQSTSSSESWTFDDSWAFAGEKRLETCIEPPFMGEVDFFRSACVCTGGHESRLDSFAGVARHRAAEEFLGELANPETCDADDKLDPNEADCGIIATGAFQYEFEGAIAGAAW